ncbi:MAG: hypothetical protein LBB54_03575, partial [Cellulomonadaceae bacterium]|nr:hypothetical protein [Cellulomonadaceae bacterium]
SKTWTAWFASHIAPSDHTYVQHLLTTYKPDSDDAARTPLKITEGSVGDIVTVDGVNWTLVSGGKDYLSAKNGLDDYNNGICLLSSPSKATGTEKSATCTQGKLSQSISSWLGTKGFMFVPFTGSPNPAPSATMNAKWWPTVGSVVTLRVKASEYNTGEVKGAEWLYIDVTRVAGGSDANPMLNWLKYTQSTSESVYFFAATYTWEETLTIPAAPPAAPPAPQPPIEVGGGQPIPGEEEGEEPLDPGDVGSTVPVDETGNTVVIEKTTIVNNTVTKEIPALAITGGPAPKLALTGEAPKLALTGIDGSVVFAAIMLLGTGCALVASTRREQEVTA